MYIFLELCKQKLEANNSYLVFLMKNTLGYGLQTFLYSSLLSLWTSMSKTDLAWLYCEDR